MATRMTRGNEALGETFEQYTEGARGKIKELRDTVGHYYGEGLQKAKDLERNLEHHIQARPMQSILIAAGVALAAGLLIGALVRR